jgi:3-hydroxyisobutyrate dehydrogenase-like beta-hydroxyacid dehydrogenase
MITKAVALVGLGNMGHPMARNLLAAGIPLTIWNRTASKGDDLVAAGATRAASIAEAGRCDIVITMVSDDAALKQTLFDGGLIGAMKPGAIHVSMSTISVALADTLAKEHDARSLALVCAPVMGRPDAAVAAKLFILAAGRDDAIDRCQPLFDAMGQRTFRFGDHPGSAVVVKLSVNFLIAALIESLSEASVLVSKHGVSTHALVDLLTSTLFSAPVYKTYGAIVADKRYRPAGFPAPLGLKDMSLVLDAAREANAPMPLASLVRDHLIAAIALGYGDADWSALGAVVANNAGLGKSEAAI